MTDLAPDGFDPQPLPAASAFDGLLWRREGEAGPIFTAWLEPAAVETDTWLMLHARQCLDVAAGEAGSAARLASLTVDLSGLPAAAGWVQAEIALTRVTRGLVFAAARLVQGGSLLALASGVWKRTS